MMVGDLREVHFDPGAGLQFYISGLHKALVLRCVSSRRNLLLSPYSSRMN